MGRGSGAGLCWDPAAAGLLGREQPLFFWDTGVCMRVTFTEEVPSSWSPGPPHQAERLVPECSPHPPAPHPLAPFHWVGGRHAMGLVFCKGGSEQGPLLLARGLHPRAPCWLLRGLGMRGPSPSPGGGEQGVSLPSPPGMGFAPGLFACHSVT